MRSACALVALLRTLRLWSVAVAHRGVLVGSPFSRRKLPVSLNCEWLPSGCIAVAKGLHAISAGCMVASHPMTWTQLLAAKRHQLAMQQTQTLIAELLTPGNSGVKAGVPAFAAGVPTVQPSEGRYGGTCVVRELVYGSAMWISLALQRQNVTPNCAVRCTVNGLRTLAPRRARPDG